MDPSVRADRSMWWALGVVGAVAGVVLVATLLSPVVARSHAGPGPIQPGDEVLVDLVVYDAGGLPIFATSEEEARRLENATGSPFILGPGHPAFGAVRVRAGEPSDVPGDLTRLFVGELSGRSAGFSFATDVREQPFGGWGEQVVMPRVVGPFPLAPVVSREVFEREFPGVGVGDGIELHEPATAKATVVSVTKNRVTYLNHLAEGQVLLIHRLGVRAQVLVEEDAGAFFLRFEIGRGDEFSVRGTCGPPFYSLEQGSYRVLRVNDTQVEMAYNPSPFPPLVGRDLFTVVDVLEVQRPLGAQVAGVVRALSLMGSDS